MEIRPTPASIAQVAKVRDGRMVEITDDVQGIANQLAEIDPHLRLRYSEAGEHFVVYFKPDGVEEGDGYLVTTAQELDHRIVNVIREIHHRMQQPGYSFADELDKRDDEAKKQAEHDFTEAHGGMYERLAFAMRKELGLNQSRTVVPKDVPK